MSTKCTKQLTISEPDMPLDQAIYVPAPLDMIFAIRDGRLFSFDPTTGFKIQEAVIAEPYNDKGCLTFVPSNSMLYVGICGCPVGVGQFTQNADLYQVDPLNFAVATALNMRVKLGLAFPMEYIHLGPTSIATDGNTNVAMTFTSDGGVVYYCGFDVTNVVPTFWKWSLGSSANHYYHDCCWNSTASRFFFGNGDIPRIEKFTTGGVQTSTTIPNYLGKFAFPYGICHNPINNCIYYPLGTTVLRKLDVGSGIHTEISIARPFFVTYHARFNPYDGKVYLAGGGDNTIAVVDIADNVTIKTGFDVPVDVVFTPTKKWAVQKASRGLKEIT